MSSHQDHPHNSHDYQRDAEHARRRLAANLDELSDRLTPGQVFDEVLTYSRAGGGTFYRAFANAMRDNPLPSLIIGAGCLMFMSEKVGGLRASGGRNAGDRLGEDFGPCAADFHAGSRQEGASAAAKVSSAVSGAFRRAAGAVSGAAGAASGAGGRVTGAASQVAQSAAGTTASIARTAAASVQAGAHSAAGLTTRHAGAVADAARGAAMMAADTVSSATDALRSTASGVGGQASDAMDSVRQGAANAADAGRGYSSSLAARASDAADRTRRQAQDAVRQGRETATSFISDQPLLSAAIGVAVGAAIASLLPKTEAEDQWLGEASDRVKDAAGEIGANALDSAKSFAGKVAERTQEAAEEEGLTPAAIGEAARGGRQEAPPRQPVSGAGPQEWTGTGL